MRFVSVRHFPWITVITLAAGCASSNKQPSPGEQGWTQVGAVSVKADQDRSVLRAESLPGKYKSLCVEADGPVVIERLGASFTDTTTFLADEQITFTGPDRRVIEMSGGEHQILHVVLVHSGGTTVLGTKITVWVR